MLQKKKSQTEYSTCLENVTFAEAIQKAMDQHGGHSCINQLPVDSNKSTAGRSTKNGWEAMVESVMKLHSCADCPIRHRAAAKPQSLFARVHRWHKTWWPGWKMYQSESHFRTGKKSAGNKIDTMEEL